MAVNNIRGSSQTADLIRAKDWSKTPLGPIEGWSPSLLISLNMALAVPTPVQVLWGREMIVFYNDAFMPILTHKHPDALGLSARQVWKDVGTQLELVFSDEKALTFVICPSRY